MPSPRDAPGARLLSLWARLSPLPGGRRLFSAVLGRMVPYSGTIGARVEELAPGSVRLTLRDRHRVRNHLRSVHAVALTNLGELASGLAVLTLLPPGVRGIVTALETHFHRKARGLLTAISTVEPPPTPDDPGAWYGNRTVTTTIRDAEGSDVATFHATWRLGPQR